MNNRNVNSLRFQVKPKTFEECGHRRLAGAVSCGLWQAPISGQAGNHHQVPLAARGHLRHHRRRAVRGANHVDINYFRNFFAASGSRHASLAQCRHWQSGHRSALVRHATLNRRGKRARVLHIGRKSNALLPNASISPTNSSSASTRLAIKPNFAPRRASSTASPRPMPDDAPVIITTFPVQEFNY